MKAAVLILLPFLFEGTESLASIRKSSIRMTAPKLPAKSPASFFPFSSTVPRQSSTTQLFAEKDMSGGVKGGEAARQLLGVKGGTKSTNIWAIRLQLCKPVTWIPLIWGVACGAGYFMEMYHRPFFLPDKFEIYI